LRRFARFTSLVTISVLILFGVFLCWAVSGSEVSGASTMAGTPHAEQAANANGYPVDRDYLAVFAAEGEAGKKHHRLHMVRSKAQSDGTRVCPSTYIPVPTLTINANFDISTSSGNVRLSSGDASTIHMDFWNTWDQDSEWSDTGGDDGRHFGGLNALVVHCINMVPPDKPRPTPCRAPTATA
jgi:hypothetical protein